jgi:hypothetical protein
MSELIRLTWDALFLSESPYSDMRESAKPALRGLGIVVILALTIALVGLIGTTLAWATSPSLADIQRVVLDSIQRMPWYLEMGDNPEFREQFMLWFETGWQVFPYVFGAPSIASAAANIAILPLGWALIWLIYGLVAHLTAKILGGEGSLGQLLGCTALAFAPQMFKLATILPYIVVGGVVGTWSLLARYVALKTSHRLSSGRALVATLAPYILLSLVMIVIFTIGGFVFAAFFSGGVLS